MEIVYRNTAELQPAQRRAIRGFQSGVTPKQVLSRTRDLHLLQPLQRTTVQYLPTIFSRIRSHIDYPVGMTDNIDLMFHNKQRITRIF